MKIKLNTLIYLHDGVDKRCEFHFEGRFDS